MGKRAIMAIGWAAVFCGMALPLAGLMAQTSPQPLPLPMDDKDAAVALSKDPFAPADALPDVPAGARPLDTPSDAALQEAMEQVQDLFPHTTARPLFRADRRPAPPAPRPVASAPPAAEPPVMAAAPEVPEARITKADYVLTGVVQAGARSLAMLENTWDGTTHVIRPGHARLPGRDGVMVHIKVTEIDAGQVTFVADTQLTLHLYDAATARLSAKRVPGRALRFAETVSEEDRRMIRVIASDMGLPAVPPALRPQILPQAPLNQR